MTAVSSYKNTRLAPRFKFRNRESCESKLIDKIHYTESVISTVDLSPSGIAFLNPSKKLLKVGETCMVELSPFGAQPIRSFIKIIRAEPVAGTMLYGAQFIALPLLHQERLDKMIRSAHFTEQIDTYVDTRDLRIRINPTQLAKQMTWVALILTTVFAVSRVVDTFFSS